MAGLSTVGRIFCMKITKGYDFDDLLLEPKVSWVNSRADVDISVSLNSPMGNLVLSTPIIASPMKGIISEELIILLSHIGGLGIQHRFFDSNKERYDSIERISKQCRHWGASIGLDDMEGLNLLDFNPPILCIDVANGNLDIVRKWVHIVKKVIIEVHSDTLLMVGNVATYPSAKLLVESGADLIRVGIGNGALCTTRNVTGVGIPQLTAIDNCGNIDAYIVCDGGIRNSGDAVKALAMGADLIMMGTPFARTYESANNGIIYGQASRKLQEDYYHSVKSVEGLEKEVIKDISLKDLISEFTWGMRSAFTYLNAKSIKELQKNAICVETGTGSIKKL